MSTAFLSLDNGVVFLIIGAVIATLGFCLIDAWLMLRTERARKSLDSQRLDRVQAVSSDWQWASHTHPEDVR